MIVELRINDGVALRTEIWHLVVKELKSENFIVSLDNAKLFVDDKEVPKPKEIFGIKIWDAEKHE